MVAVMLHNIRSQELVSPVVSRVFLQLTLSLTLLGPQSRFGDTWGQMDWNLFGWCPQNGTGVLKGLNASTLM